MTKKAEKKDPGVDEQVTVEVIDPAPEQRDDPKPADLTHAVNGLWPGNPPNRSGNFYFDLNRLELKPGQTGLLGNLCENFVFERVDVHMIRPADSGFSLELLLDDQQWLDGFNIEPESLKTQRSEPAKLGRVQPGTFLGKQRVYLTVNDELPKQGRMVINFVGYLIEPWR